MTLDEIILKSTDGLGTFPVLETGCDVLGLTLTDFCTQFALRVARGYHSGVFSWEDGDGAMNSLYYSFVYKHDSSEFPEIAYAVFSAFDDGEYRHRGDNPDLDPQQYTKEQITDLVSKVGA